MYNHFVNFNKSIVLELLSFSPWIVKNIMNVSIPAMVRMFSFGERLISSFNSGIASLNETINFSTHENILTIALIKINYLYTIYHWFQPEKIITNLLQFDSHFCQD